MVLLLLYVAYNTYEYVHTFEKLNRIFNFVYIFLNYAIVFHNNEIVCLFRRWSAY